MLTRQSRFALWHNENQKLMAGFAAWQGQKGRATKGRLKSLADDGRLLAQIGHSRPADSRQRQATSWLRFSISKRFRPAQKGEAGDPRNRLPLSQLVSPLENGGQVRARSICFDRNFGNNSCWQFLVCFTNEPIRADSARLRLISKPAIIPGSIQQSLTSLIY